MIEVVIPVHNRREITLECLRQLRAQTGSRFHVTVVDDGSSDGTSEAIGAAYPEVTVLSGDGNLWWAAATNLGVRHVLASPEPPDYILLLNDDVKIPETFVAELKRCADQHPDALIASLAVYVDDPERVLWCGVAASHKECTAGYVPRSVLSGSVQARALPGRGMLVPSQAFVDVDFIDAETFPQYLADFDFSRRVNQRGYGLICCCDTEVEVMTRETGAGSVHLDVPLPEYLKSYFNDRSQNFLPMLWRYYTRHGGLVEFAHQVTRRLGGELLRRTGIRRRPEA